MDTKASTLPARPSRTSKKRRVLRAAFVVTTSVAATGAAGCGSDVMTNPPPIECPNGVPTLGTSCPEEGECTYTSECSSDIIATCEADGTWDVEYTGTCNPPPPVECPTATPIDGDDCFEPQNCSYGDPCGGSVNASCDGVTWTVEYSNDTCNPPPPCPGELPEEGSECNLTPGGVPEGCVFAAETPCGVQMVGGVCLQSAEGTFVWDLEVPECNPQVPACETYTNSALCDADTTCRWLTPGCDEGPSVVFDTGCYPIADCTANGCEAEEACTQITFDPCWNSNCDACGAQANVCLPPPFDG